MSEQIIYNKASAKDIAIVIEAMEPVLVGYPTNTVMMACIALAIILQAPDIKVDHLTRGVTGASEWIALYLAGLGTEDKAVLN